MDWLSGVGEVMVSWSSLFEYNGLNRALERSQC